MADDGRVLWGVRVHVMPAPVPWSQPAVLNLLVTARTEAQARNHALIAAAMCGRHVLVDEDGSMIYAEAVPAT